jgi:conjugal transfer pilus assembly protein TraK
MTMRELAMNRIPAGYGLRNPVDSDPRVICKIPGLKLESGQTLDGHNVIVIVNKATNTNAAPLEVNAGACYRPDVLSVAVWPHILLQPGQATELYVLFKRPDPKAQTSTRPSLLSRGK